MRKLAKHWLYVAGARGLRERLGIKAHYRLRYQEYLISPRWLLLRWSRKSLDGWRCRDCGTRAGLQVHHRSYRSKGKPGIIGFLSELLDTVTLCDEHHKERGKKHE